MTERSGSRTHIIAAAALAALLMASCTGRGPDGGLSQKAGGAKAISRPDQAAETAGEARGPDPRAAFESSGLLGGLSASLEKPIRLVGASGVPEAGVVLAFGAPLSSALVARGAAPAAAHDAEGRGHELVLASGARARLPGPAIAAVSSGDRAVVACSVPGSALGGVLLCFRVMGEGEGLEASWSRAGPPASRLLALPGGRIAASGDSGESRIRVIDSIGGGEAWSAALSGPAADIAYSPGLVLAAAGARLVAFDESSGAIAWTASLTARARTLSAGNGTAVVLAESGSLSAFSLADGKGIGAAPGPFDPAIKPVADGERAIAAMPGGGAEELEVKSGAVVRSWAWTGPSSFIAADRERIFAGVDGAEGRGLLIAPRAGESRGGLIELGAGTFDAPVAVGGSRGGLLVLLMDGSLALVGKDREAAASASALDAALSPPPEAQAAIASALGRFRTRPGPEVAGYLRFDIFAQGVPVETDSSFTAFRFDSAAGGRRSFAASPASAGAVVAIFDEAGRELASSVDELASTSMARAWLEKGKSYWVAAGWSFQAEPARFRLYSR